MEMDKIADKSVDMILCDLPYGTTRCKWDSLINLDRLWKHYKRIIKPSGAIVLFAQAPFDKVLAMSNIKEFRYEWIWEKTQGTGHLNANEMPMKCHENLLVFYKKLPVYNPQKTTGHKRKVATAHHKRNCSTGDIYGACANFSDYDSTERYPRSVLLFPSDKQKENYHSTQKPVALCEYMIKTYTNEGGVVLDNCSGSGTTAIACINTNRNFICIEKEEKYVDISRERVRAFTQANN